MLLGMIFSILCFIGPMRQNPLVRSLDLDLNFDIRFLFFAALLLVLLWKLCSSGVRTILPSKGVGFSYLIILLLVFLGFPLTPDPAYGSEKLLVLVTSTLSCALIPYLVLGDPESRTTKRFFQGFVAGVFLLCAGMLAAQIQYLQQESGTAGFSYITRGRLYSVLITISLLQFYLGGRQWQKMIGLLLTCIFSYFLMRGQARGPLLALLMSLVFSYGLVFLAYSLGFLLNKATFSRMKLSAMSLALPVILLPVFAGFLLYSQPQEFDPLMNRFEVLVEEDDGGTSVSERLQRYKAAVEAIERKPLIGEGIGGFSFIYLKHDVLPEETVYPHNLFLELGSESGLIAATLLLFISIHVLLRGVYRLSGFAGTFYSSAQRYGTELCVLALLVAALLNAQLSGDINDNRFVFFLLSLGDILYRKRHKTFDSKLYL